MMKKMRRLSPFLGICMILCVWYVVSKTGVFSEYVLPSPGRVFRIFGEMLVTGELIVDIVISFGRVLKGFIIAFVLAFLLGTVCVLVPTAVKSYEYMIEFFRNVPPLSMIPLLILWCGIGETTKIIIIVLAAFFPMYLNIVKGFTGCDRRLLEVGDAFGYSRFEKFTKIVLPFAAADIMVGMRIGMGYSWRAIIGAEMVAASSGLGYMILFSQQMSRTDKVIAGILAIGIVGIVTDRLFGVTIRKLLKGAGENGWN